MREIKFRGKRVDNGEWIEGSLFNVIWRKSSDGSRVCYIFPDNMLGWGDCWEDFAEIAEEYEVDPSTVGQYVGLKNKDGREIYEGDILRLVTDFGEIFNREVYYWDGRFGIHIEDETDILSIAYAVEANSAEIIGNIHDNPDLLKPKE